ncbi:signal recognition particle-docking protein FtsY [Salinarimonas sp.]|uniref:signal recognition particle-docking protein FtsY n=1 Tax=Salinarimonas sp. TaxID=2766526 RepID=UPI0032D92B7B
MADETEKRGFFSRLFGRKGEAPKDEAGPRDEVTPDEQAPERAAAPPDAVPPAASTVTEPSPDAVAHVPDELAGADLQPIEPEGEEAREAAIAEELAEQPAPAGKPAPEQRSPEALVAPKPEPAPAPAPEPEPEPEPAPASAPAAAAQPKVSWWRRLTQGLARTSSSMGSAITSLFTKRRLDEATLEDLEDILIQADLGVPAATRITQAVAKGRYEKEIPPEEVKRVLAEEVERSLAEVARPLALDRSKKPFVILTVGVNGAGKTTTIGKLAAKFRAQKLSVTMAAGDTFRAAAIEQLKIWGERTKSRVVAREQGADAAGLAFDALTEAKREGVDVLLVDTAGRLQNKAGLMSELEKIVRVMKKVDDTAPHAVLLVLDATVGQNALSQVELFQKAAGVTGLVMTKLDGTARGGILVALAERFGLPVHFIGVGEGVEDLEPFAARDFARAIAGLEEG